MSEKQFDIFDEPFRKAAEHVEPEFDEASWAKMEAKLDKNLRRKPSRWFFWFSDILMIAILITLAVEFQTSKSNFKPANQTKTLPVQNENKNPDTESINKVAAKKKALNAAAKPADKENSETPMVERNAATAQKNNQSKIVPALNNTQNGKAASNAVAFNKSNVSASKSIQVKNRSLTTDSGDKSAGFQGTVDTKNNSGQWPASANAETTITANVDELSNHQLDSKNSKDFDDIFIDDDFQLLEATLKSQSAQATINDAVREDKTSKTAELNKAAPSVGALKPRYVAFKGLYLHAGISPEWSFTGNDDAGPATTAYGGGIGFASGKRWSVQAGVFTSRKVYGAGPGDYKPKPGSYFYNLKINHVDASCNILEIPVSFNYSLLSRRQHRLIASAGLSSLVMKKEIYEYDYQRWNGTQAHYKRTYKTGKFHPFSVAMLSAGYEYSLSSRLALQAMPYVKMPLYGIGEGSVKITSAGFLLGVQYGFSAFKPKKTASPKRISAGKN